MMLMKSVHHPNRISHAEHNWSATRSLLGSWRPPRTLCAPCTLEPTHGPLAPSLSPSEGERVPEGRQRRRFMGRGIRASHQLGGGVELCRSFAPVIKTPC